MQVKHVVSGELLFVFSDSTGNIINGGQLGQTTLYNCRRFVIGTGYQTVQLYGMELQAI